MLYDEGVPVDHTVDFVLTGKGRAGEKEGKDQDQCWEKKLCEHWSFDHLQLVSLLQPLPEFTDYDHVHLCKVQVLDPWRPPGRTQAVCRSSDKRSCS